MFVLIRNNMISHHFLAVRTRSAMYRTYQDIMAYTNTDS